MSGYPYHPISIERDEETGAVRCTVTANLFDEYMRMIDRGIAEQGEAAMEAALEAHGYTKERIVRCRDCKHLVAHGTGCAYWDFCDIEDVNGYCAWGERREA